MIFRTSQPLVGPNQRRNKDDERLLAAILEQGTSTISGLYMRRHHRGYIIDTRTTRYGQKDTFWDREKGSEQDNHRVPKLLTRVDTQIGYSSTSQERRSRQCWSKFLGFFKGYQSREIMCTQKAVTGHSFLHGDWSIGKSPRKICRIGQSPGRLAAVGYPVTNTHYFSALAFLCLILASLTRL